MRGKMDCSYSKSKLKVEYIKLYLWIYEQKQYCKHRAVNMYADSIYA